MTTSTRQVAPIGGATRRKGKPWTQRDRWLGLSFVLPTVILFALFSVYPFVRTIELSLTDWDGLSKSYDYVGFANYLAAFSDSVWWGSMGNGLILSVVALTVMQLLGMLLALAVNGRPRGAGIYQAVFYVPPILSGIVVAILWKWIYDPMTGALNQGLDAIGLGSLAQPWLGDARTALWAISAASVWQGVGYPFLLFLAGLQGVPVELYEAARVDGASSWHLFTRITLPLMLPVIGTVSVLTFLGGMQTFNLVLAMTNGGPGYATEVPILTIYRNAFGHTPNFGYASALSMIFGVLLLIVSLLSLRLTKRRF